MSHREEWELLCEEAVLHLVGHLRCQIQDGIEENNRELANKNLHFRKVLDEKIAVCSENEKLKEKNRALRKKLKEIQNGNTSAKRSRARSR